MGKYEIEEKELITEEDLLKISNEIETINNTKVTINDNSTPLSVQKDTTRTLAYLRYLELNLEKFKTLHNFQKKENPSFYFIKSSNEEYEKLSSSTTSLNELVFLIDLSYFDVNSIKYTIIDDMQKENYIINSILNELPTDKYYKKIIDLLKKADKNFNYNVDDIFKRDRFNLDKEIKDINKTIQDLSTKHIISKKLFDMVKDYIEKISSNKPNQYQIDKDSDVSNEYLNPESNNYYIKINDIKDIENNFDNIDEKYRKAIKKCDIEKALEVLEKLKILTVTKSLIIGLIKIQNKHLKSYTNKNKFFAYISYLTEISNELDSLISNEKEELNNIGINEYIDLINQINYLISCDQQINEIINSNRDVNLFEEKILKINIENRIKVLNIKKNRVDLSKNKFFDKSLFNNDNSKDSTTIFKQDEEIKKLNDTLCRCYSQIEDKTLIDRIHNEYVNQKLEDVIDFQVYLIAKNDIKDAELLILKEVFLEKLYTKYSSSDIDVSFEDYILFNPILTVKDIISSDEISSFLQRKNEDKKNTI